MSDGRSSVSFILNGMKACVTWRVNFSATDIHFQHVGDELFNSSVIWLCCFNWDCCKDDTAFWEVALCRLVEADRHFGGAVFLHHHGDVRTLILTWETKRNHEKPHRGYTVSRLRFELESSEIRNRNSDHYSTKLGVAAVSYFSSKGVGCFSLQTETVFIETET
jgi:hypothetical protein